MLGFLFGVFTILHGLVHLLYFGHSQKLFELQPGMIWPQGSWAFSMLFGDKKTRLLASILCILVAVGFITGGIGILFGNTWWIYLIVGSAIFSSIIFILFWDGEAIKLHDKGGVGILLNITILVIVFFYFQKN